MTFEIKLPLFEGPFDLLLFFIERDELDIHDIPISQITHDFLSYLKQLEEMNIEVASEFILVAATLMRIKAKMLLPRPELNEAGEEIDPRDELVRHLLEYKKYKSVISELASMESSRLAMNERGNVIQEINKLSEASNVEAELQDVDLYKLLKVYARVLERYEYESNRPTHQVVQYPYTISEQKDFILSALDKSRRLDFAAIVTQSKDRIGVIYNFLAILELLQLSLITITIGEGYNNFWIANASPIQEPDA
jgi:segregation and condensation protein A